MNGAKGKLHILKLEVTDEEAVKAAAQETSKIVGANGLDYLLNNAAIVSLNISLKVQYTDSTQFN